MPESGPSTPEQPKPDHSRLGFIKPEAKLLKLDPDKLIKKLEEQFKQHIDKRITLVRVLTRKEGLRDEEWYEIYPGEKERISSLRPLPRRFFLNLIGDSPFTVFEVKLNDIPEEERDEVWLKIRDIKRTQHRNQFSRFADRVSPYTSQMPKNFGVWKSLYHIDDPGATGLRQVADKILTSLSQ